MGRGEAVMAQRDHDRHWLDPATVGQDAINLGRIKNPRHAGDFCVA